MGAGPKTRNNYKPNRKYNPEQVTKRVILAPKKEMGKQNQQKTNKQTTTMGVSKNIEEES